MWSDPLFSIVPAWNYRKHHRSPEFLFERARHISQLTPRSAFHFSVRVRKIMEAELWWSDTKVGKGSTWAHGWLDKHTRMFCVHTQRVSCGVWWWLYRVCVMQFTTSHHRNWIPMEFRISKSLPSVYSHLPHTHTGSHTRSSPRCVRVNHRHASNASCSVLLFEDAAFVCSVAGLELSHTNTLKSRVQIDKMDGRHRWGLACWVTDSMMTLWVVLHYEW